MKSNFLIAANTAINDAQTNSLSLIEIIESYEVPQFPVIVPRLMLTWVVTRDANEPAEAACSIEIINGNDTTSFPLQVDFKGLLRHRATIQLQGITLLGIGNLEMRAIQIISGKKKALDKLLIPISLAGSSPMQVVIADGAPSAVPAAKKERKKTAKT